MTETGNLIQKSTPTILPTIKAPQWQKEKQASS
jgi:hypothetical protein